MPAVQTPAPQHSAASLPPTPASRRVELAVASCYQPGGCAPFEKPVAPTETLEAMFEIFVPEAHFISCCCRNAELEIDQTGLQCGSCFDFASQCQSLCLMRPLPLFFGSNKTPQDHAAELIVTVKGISTTANSPMRTSQTPGRFWIGMLLWRRLRNLRWIYFLDPPRGLGLRRRPRRGFVHGLLPCCPFVWSPKSGLGYQVE